MTGDELLTVLMAAADDVGRMFDRDDMAGWPPGSIEMLERVGLLRQAASVPMVRCPNCAESHIEPIEPCTDESDRTRWFIRCPEAMRVEVSPEQSRAWEVDPDGLSRAVGAALAIKGAPRQVVPCRLWRVGRIPWKGKTREVVLALRLADDDAAKVAAHIGTSGRAIVLVPHLAPDDRLWPGAVPPVVRLSHVLTVEASGLVLDGVSLLEMVEAADAVAERLSVLPIDPALKRAVVQRQVNVAIDCKLERDALRAAVRQEGSVRKAASMLTERLGRKVSKDKVQRAMKAAGGAKDAVDAEDSASVARTVASRPRDRAAKRDKFLK